MALMNLILKIIYNFIKIINLEHVMYDTISPISNT